MKPATVAGVILIVLGLAVLAGVTYTSRETVLKVGPITATADRERTILPPLAGGVAVIAGIGLVVAGRRTRG